MARKRNAPFSGEGSTFPKKLTKGLRKQMRKVKRQNPTEFANVYQETFGDVPAKKRR